MGARVNVRSTPIAGAVVVETRPHQDTRGAFTRLFCADALSAVIGSRQIVQINQSRTLHAGAVRGMHFQRPPHAEMKLVRCIRGRVWDVVVDLRAGSPTFLRWHAQELDAESARMLVIPEGCAHGFQVLEANSELLYLHTAYYTPYAEAGVRHDDPRLGIRWPLAATDLSSRDQAHAPLSDDFAGIQV
ncbi:dTDP-4-dehydrorhamnose 3%2C5-epimerase [Achromobacter xylosoxidans]|jgi:dTDP-4-dehydrorhamnose 3,5-epimerase|nr:dTDP-4-dehydrorhamnose 3,5-epimerase [Achromobacter xylosoxidans]QQE58013.1 dTDP-4-dehydrorhamnose 3,5-epimerase [Achromobacter xylosoxidans]QQV11762.1 dTDP-4-dehydrorhamnose 3,5-epimerase [Achromobacter xylosoxidans]CUJ07568.1 dTDP-4-dehydrorhamnose 3%2C5-epimerase [Achromobacter xylosoxidans]CUJ65365.1 dTDP-4-dehydrorhamnose 3%2C5-epimerase [Achromobacter xylosoxidans]CUJ69146.1 dTDP-4-dehydrorhamnose 3%2C5-epimerase [Achromobacter xylosoxidans]